MTENTVFRKTFNINNITFLQWGECRVNRPYPGFPGDDQEKGTFWLHVSFVGGSSLIAYGDEAKQLRQALTEAK